MTFALKSTSGVRRSDAGRPRWALRVVGILAVGFLAAGCAGASEPNPDLPPESVLPLPTLSSQSAPAEVMETAPTTTTQAPPAATSASTAVPTEVGAPSESEETPTPGTGSVGAVPPAVVPTMSSDAGFVAMCPYDDGSGVIANLPCDAPQFATASPVPPSEPAEITCQTPCTTSGCEQYKEFVLNC